MSTLIKGFLLNPPRRNGRIAKVKKPLSVRKFKLSDRNFNTRKSFRSGSILRYNPTRIVERPRFSSRVLSNPLKVKKYISNDNKSLIETENKKGVFIPKFTIKKRKSVMKKSRKAKKIKKFVAKIVKAKKIKRSVKQMGKHRLSVIGSKRGLKVVKKSRLAKRYARKGILINPLRSMNPLGTVKEAGILVIGMLGSTIIPTYALPEKYRTGYLKPVSQIATGIVMYMLVKKFLKKEAIAKQLLLGSVITVVKELADTYVVPKIAPTQSVAGLSGLKMLPRKVAGLQVPNQANNVLSKVGSSTSTVRMGARRV